MAVIREKIHTTNNTEIPTAVLDSNLLAKSFPGETSGTTLHIMCIGDNEEREDKIERIFPCWEALRAIPQLWSNVQSGNLSHSHTKTALIPACKRRNALKNLSLNEAPITAKHTTNICYMQVRLPKYIHLQVKACQRWIISHELQKSLVITVHSA